MTDHPINAHCRICGAGYHICSACRNEKKFRPWRSVTDTIDHYKIYMAIHEYTVTKKKEPARSELLKCNLSDLETFQEDIRSVIEEIMR